MRKIGAETSASWTKENRYPGLHFGIAQVPRRLPAQEMHPFKGLPGRRRRHVAQNCRQKSSASRLAGEPDSPIITN